MSDSSRASDADAPRVATPISPYETAADPEVSAATDSVPTVSTRRPRIGRRVALVALIVAVLAYAGAAFVLKDRIAAGTTVASVEVGTTAATATVAVAATDEAARAQDVVLTAGPHQTSVAPDDAGLAIDVAGTVDSLTGFTLAPVVLWQRAFGFGSDVEPVLALDNAKLATAVAAAAGELNSDPEDASVTIADGVASSVESTPGVVVDESGTRAAIVDAWPTPDPIAAPAEVTDAVVTTNDATAFAAYLNGTAFSAAVTLTGPNGDVELSGPDIAQYSSVATADARLVHVVDGEALAPVLVEADPGLENDGRSASYAFTPAHNLTVVTAVPGRTVDPAGLGEAVVAATQSADRTAELPYVEKQPKVSAEDLPTQDFTTKISSFRTPLTPEPIRTKNLARGAQLVTGTVVKPGERFDLTKVLEPFTAANGYFEAHIIVNGILTNGVGGGLSQMATTTYNAGYFAGMKDITHRPHSVWFSRYPAGRESTIFSGQINMVFENTTPYALIMNSYVAGGYLHVDVWSKPHFTVTTYASPKTNITKPGVTKVSAANCEAKGPGEPGFTITNTRGVYLDGELVEKNRYRWTYKPDNAIQCV